MEKWYERFQDQGFIDYYESGEAAAVHVVRDCAAEVNTAGKWIDVISANTFKSQSDGKIGFNWIIVELFPRIHHPRYTDDRYYNRYLTLHTAHDDIAEHRSKNHHGEKFLVICELKRTKQAVNGEQGESVDNHVIDSCKVNQKQIRSIESSSAKIVSDIRTKRKLSLTLFPI